MVAITPIGASDTVVEKKYGEFIDGNVQGLILQELKIISMLLREMAGPQGNYTNDRSLMGQDRPVLMNTST